LLFLQGALKEKLDPAEGDGGGRARVLLDVLEVKKVLPEFFLGDVVRGSVIMFGQLAHGSDVRLLSSLRQSSELETLDYSLSQFGHDDTSSMCES
jgi:hypothetical protein